jgi:hypothetical protein
MKKYPFKFLDAYSQEDTDIFFGRDEEIAALYEMVFQSSILLVYGASGTGKTSLLQCGLASKFQSHDWLALTVRRGNNINASLEKVLADAGGYQPAAEEGMAWLEEIMEQETATATKPLTPLAQSIKDIYLNAFRPLYLIFDQLEEVFILGSPAEQEAFIQTIKAILEAEQPVKIIFSIREEYLGYLNHFERAVPQLLRKKLRVEPMNLDKVRHVIVGATSNENSNVRLKKEETEAIAEGIFDRIKDKEKILTVQLPYLQVFLDKLYLTITGDETNQAEAVITMQDLQAMGDIGDVLRNFLEEQVAAISKRFSEKHPQISADLLWNLLSPFATLEGTKEPISKAGLYERFPELEPMLIDGVVEAFINSRILRYSEDADLYELAHDSLAKRIAEKRSDEEIALLEIRRLVKSQTALKESARELFSEKQLDFITPFLGKILLTEEERTLIQQSHDAVVRRKAAEGEAQEAEAQRLLERQQLLEKNQRSQRRFIRWIGLALVIMIALAIWAYAQKQKASQSAKETEMALAKIKKEQALSKAKEFKSFGDSYKDLGSRDNACDSYGKGLKTLERYPDDPLYRELTNLKDSLKCE